MRVRHLVLLAATLGTLLAGPAQAQWKWRDKTGQIQYSDLAPPAGTPDAAILQRPNVTPIRASATAASAASGVAVASAASGVPGIAPKSVEPELEAKRKKAEQDKADKLKADNEKRAAAQAENCTRARSYMRSLDDGIRITRSNANGEREILDDKSRADEVKRTRDIIASDCK